MRRRRSLSLAHRRQFFRLFVNVIDVNAKEGIRHRLAKGMFMYERACGGNNFMGTLFTRSTLPPLTEIPMDNKRAAMEGMDSDNNDDKEEEVMMMKLVKAKTWMTTMERRRVTTMKTNDNEEGDFHAYFLQWQLRR